MSGSEDQFSLNRAALIKGGASKRNFLAVLWLAQGLAAISVSAAMFTVTTGADSGPGSLREAIGFANAASTAPRVINFNIPGGGVQTIALASALPAVTKATMIDATTQPGYAG